jgi:DNA helicase-2/ATP-dependent DNA helicase PcrA
VDVILRFAEEMMTGVGRSDLLRRIQSLNAGTARKQASEIELAILGFAAQRSPHAASEMLLSVANGPDVRIYRPTALRGCVRALQLCADTQGLTLHEAAIRVREHYRAYGRSLPRRAIGSTLLLKGLEAEVVVVLNADTFDARNLYVAMSRGSKCLVVCSKSPVLTPIW